MKKNKTIKAWIYLWPENKKITEGQVVYKKLPESTKKNLNLREIPVLISPNNKG